MKGWRITARHSSNGGGYEVSYSSPPPPLIEPKQAPRWITLSLRFETKEAAQAFLDYIRTGKGKPPQAEAPRAA
jgi:hypothetical protein